MDRREALQLLAIGTALPLAPSRLLAMLREARISVEAQRASRILNAHQEATVKAMAELILPRTDTPGATDVGVTDFADLMLTDWYDDEDRGIFVNGLADVDSRTMSRFGKAFLDCTPDQQAQILSSLGEEMEDQANRPRDRETVASRPTFYFMLRKLTLTAYYTSEAGATEELNFQIIPDHHDGCAPFGSHEPPGQGPENP